MLTLWGRTNSVNVRKVHWLLLELDLPFDHVVAGGAAGGNHTPDFLARNPNGLVPVVQDGDAIVWESNAVLRYLAAAHAAGTDFWPQDPAARAVGDRWMDWASLGFGQPFRDIFWNLVRAAPEQRNDQEVASGLKQGAALLRIVAGQLDRTPFLSGDRFGLGDIPLATQLQALSITGSGLEIPEPVQAWYDRLRQTTRLATIEQISLL